MTTHNAKHAKIAEKVTDHHQKVVKLAHQVAKDKHPALPTEDDFHQALKDPCAELIDSLVNDGLGGEGGLEDGGDDAIAN